MSSKKNNKSKREITIRSSAAEYLTFITASGEGDVAAIYADENVWLSQKMMAMLYNIETHTINYHLKKVFSDNELQEDSVIRNFRITAPDGKEENCSYPEIPDNYSEMLYKGRNGATGAACQRLLGYCRIAGRAENSHDDGGLGNTAQQFSPGG